MKTKPHILIFIDWFYPAYKAGGPVKSVFNLVQALHQELQFYIVCSNIDIDGEELAVKTNEWTNFQETPVIYLTKEQQKKSIYQQIFKKIKPDLIYYNSLFSKSFTLLPYRLFKKEDVKQIICPRGMLGKGSLAVKPFKKKIFLKLAKTFFFRNENTLWQATSEQEKKDIQNHIGLNVPIRMAGNLSSPIQNRSPKTIQKSQGKLRLVFISRILPIKNLNFVLEFMEQLKDVEGISLSIYGPLEDISYWEKCKVILEKDKRITYKGVLAPHEIATTLQQYHFYVLPTLHENYGHSIVEAVVAGVPIIISENTPWRNLEKEGVGADIGIEEKEKWKNYLVKAVEMDQGEYKRMVESCFAFAKEKILNEGHVEACRRLFE